MIDLFIYCAGLVGLIVFASWVVELVYNAYDNNWRSRVTAHDIENLKTLFETDGAFVGFNEQGEKFLVGYNKD